ncbi:MAG: HDOD domain-containing protein [Vampirovibrionales bacterium]
MMFTTQHEPPSIDEIIARFENASPPPTALMQVLNLMERPEVSAEDLAEVIRNDQRLTAVLLKLCNSAAYGLAKKIETIQNAVAILGFKTLKSLVYSMLSHSTLNKPLEGYGLDSGALWTNALTGALFAKSLAKKHGWADPEVAFTAGLLRDMGKLALNDYVGQEPKQVEIAARKNQDGYDKAEASVFGIDHAELGYEIAKKWQLPESLCLAIRYHHHPRKLKDDNPAPELLKVVSTVHLADILAVMNGYGVGSDGLMYTLDETILKTLQFELTPLWLESTVSELSACQAEANAFKQALTS